jgi:hypothetical protein
MIDPADLHSPSALAAAELATEATVELLRFRREGLAIGDYPFGDPEPVAQLAEALLRTARIEAELYPQHARIDSPVQTAEYLCGLGQLAAACVKFLEDQCRIVVPEAHSHEE